jgi:hypothetical protein
MKMLSVSAGSMQFTGASSVSRGKCCLSIGISDDVCRSILYAVRVLNILSIFHNEKYLFPDYWINLNKVMDNLTIFSFKHIVINEPGCSVYRKFNKGTCLVYFWPSINRGIQSNLSVKSSVGNGKVFLIRRPLKWCSCNVINHCIKKKKRTGFSAYNLYQRWYSLQV